jgi:hypothetical protein
MRYEPWTAWCILENQLIAFYVGVDSDLNTTPFNMMKYGHTLLMLFPQSSDSEPLSWLVLWSLLQHPSDTKDCDYSLRPCFKDHVYRKSHQRIADLKIELCNFTKIMVPLFWSRHRNISLCPYALLFRIAVDMLIKSWNIVNIKGISS